jgi:serine/threonine protein kinase
MALPEGTLLRGGRYRIQKLISHGMLDFVYLAFDRVAGRQIVLKELLPTLVNDAHIVRRFVREGRTMQRLRHPHIARAEAAFRERGNYYLVIEHVQGRPLSYWTDQGHKMSLPELAPIAAALCDALDYLHQRGIVHCDLNPSNVMLDREGHVKLVDLGIAHVADEFVHRAWRTQMASGMGTVPYMAPEQIDGQRDDPRVDQYALGALLYHLLAGRPYVDFDLRNTPGAQAENVHRVRGDMPREIPGVPPEVNAVIVRALAKNPDDRYPDVNAMRQEWVRAVFPHLPPDLGIRLLAPFGVGGANGVAPAVLDGGRWVFWVLLAANVTVMLIVALLLIGMSIGL